MFKQLTKLSYLSVVIMAKRKHHGKRSQRNKKSCKRISNKLKHLRKHLPILRGLSRSKPDTRIKILKHANKDDINVIVQLVKNLLAGNIHVSKQHRQKLKQKRSSIRKFIRPGSLKSRRTALIQKGGIFPFLLPLIKTLAGSVAGSAIRKAVG